jgi:phosphoribosyl-AMP cyclohydrolase
MNWLDQIKWDDKGLVPVIAQEKDTGDVMMFAWMNREALQKTAELKRAVYFSRSRNKLWFKGEESGHVQTVHDIRIDCDNDVVLAQSDPAGARAGHCLPHGPPQLLFPELAAGRLAGCGPGPEGP